MDDIVKELRQSAEENEYLLPANETMYWAAADEIERLREAVELLLPHALYLLTQMEDGLMADPSALRSRINKARAALGEGE
jgi:hypothetical protein